MLEKFLFENHLGQRFEGLPNGVYLNYNDLRDYAWSYDTINNRISRFFMGARNRKLPIVVLCKSDNAAVETMNRLHELAEVDIAAKIPGRIIVGDWYTNGYITASTKSNYLITKRLCNIELTLTSDDPAWYREQTYVFAKNEAGSVLVGDGADYPYDYKYDYAATFGGRTIRCDSIGSNAFRMVIYGKIENPTVIIGGHTYSVNGTVEQGEILTIDSLTKTITLTTASGARLNWFDKRNRDSYVFEPIPAGLNDVAYSAAFAFDLTVIEKRSEPKWI